MAFDLPILDPPDYSPRAVGGSSGGSGLPLFSLSASVGLDAKAFDAGIATLSSNITVLNTSISTLLSALGTTLDGIATDLSNLGTSAGSAATAVDTALDGLDGSLSSTQKTIDGLDDDFATVETDFADAAVAIDKAGAEAKQAGTELSSAVGDASDAAQKGTSKFDDFARAASAAWTAVTNVATAVWNVGVALVDSATTYEQRRRTYAMAFKGIETEAETAIKSLESYSGYYTGILEASFAKMQTQFRSAGYTQAEALNLSSQAMILAADAAAAYGISLDDATYKVMSFLRGNSEAGESIGLFTSMAARNAKATAMYQKEWKDLEEAERQAVMLSIAQETYASGGQTGAAVTYSNSFTVAKQNLMQIYADLLGKLGTPIMEAITPALQDLAAVLSSPGMEETIDLFAKAIGDFVSWLAGALTGFLEWLSTEEGQAAFTKVMDTIRSILGWFGYLNFDAPPVEDQTAKAYEEVYGLGKEAPEYYAYSPGVAHPEYVKDRRYESLPKVLRDLIDATDIYYDIITDPKATEEWQSYARQTRSNARTAFEKEYGEAALSVFDAWINYQSDIDDANSQWRYYNGPMPGLYDALKDVLPMLDIEYDPGEALSGLATQFSTAVVSAISGVTVQMDGVVVGHLVAPTVMGDMARNVNFVRNTTKST